MEKPASLLPATDVMTGFLHGKSLMIDFINPVTKKANLTNAFIIGGINLKMSHKGQTFLTRKACDIT